MNTMTLNTKKFKNQLSDNLITPITNHFQEDLTNIKFLLRSLKQLSTSTKKLKDAAKGLEKYADEVERLHKQWQFESQPHLEKIQQITDKLKE